MLNIYFNVIDLYDSWLEIHQLSLYTLHFKKEARGHCITWLTTPDLTPSEIRPPLVQYSLKNKPKCLLQIQYRDRQKFY